MRTWKRLSHIVATGCLMSVILGSSETARGQSGPEACCFTTGCANWPVQQCLASGGVPQGPGTNCGMPDICSDSGCVPTPDHKRCRPGSCTNPDQSCQPRCTQFNPATGIFEVIDCDCLFPTECHMVFAQQVTPATPCIQPDNGAGSVDLPPAGCDYQTPNGDMHIIHGLPQNTTIDLDASHEEWSSVVRSPGGSLGGEVEQFSSVLRLPMTGTGQLSGFSRTLAMVAQCEVHVAPRSPGDAVQTFDTTLFAMQTQIFGDPDFDLLRIIAGNSFGLPSPGHTTLTRLPSGNFTVDSFFDITYRIDFVGAPGSVLQGMSGSTTATVRFQAGIPTPKCSGPCPPGQVCVRTKTQQADGSVVFCCDCEPDPSLVCRPKPDGSACEQVNCADGTQQCKPVAWGTNAAGQAIITACDCRGVDDCKLEMIAGTPPSCAGACPNPGQQCQQIPNAAGGFRCDCQCQSASNCDDGNPCTIDECINGVCEHIPVVCNDNNPCTTDACDPVSGTCIYTPINCDDGDICTQDSCDPDTGACIHTPIPGCGSTCQPKTDLSGCQPVTCPIAGDRCQPRCVRHNPATGTSQVLDCDCRNPEECHVKLQSGALAQSCVVPDNGTGTADLPPQGCAYETPDEDMHIIDGLPPGTTIQADSFFDVFFDITVAPGGSLGGEVEQYKATLHMPMMGTGALAGFSRSLAMTAQCEVHTAPRPTGDDVQTFDTDMFYTRAQITGDPDFDLLRVTGGTGFGMPSPGHTTLTRLPSGNWSVDSFFDITYRIDFVGAPGSVLAGMSGSTTATIRIQAGTAIPDCVGLCPPGTTCVKQKIQNADGSIDICCDCQPDQPQDCRPLPDGSACEPVNCPDPTQQCVPVAWGTDAAGVPVITACDCRSTDECHLDLVAGAPPSCVGACPDPADPCREIPNSTGGFRCECQCLTASDCDDGDPCTIDECINGVCVHTTIVCNDNNPCTTDSCDPLTGACIYTPIDCDDGNACTDDRCDPATGQCLHTAIVCDDNDPCTGDTCDPATGCVFTPIVCNDNNPCTDDFCGPNGCFYVPKNCDDGDICTTDSCDPTTGACVHILIPGCGDVCRPLPDGSACEPVDCPDPTQQQCVPVGWGIDAAGQPIITACDCRGVEECQLQHEPGTAPSCAGACPNPAIPCQQKQNAAGGFDCDCGCAITADCDDGDPCTIDECIGGMCVYTTIVCNDNDPCTIDSCDPLTGGCIFTPINCDDGNACTDDRCDPATGQCLHTPVICDDNNSCTSDTCDPATGCVFTPIVCNDNDLCTVDSCDPAVGCVFTPVVCVPQNACLIASCDSNTGQCVQVPKNCNDGDPCTQDGCNPATGACVHTPIPGCGEVPKWSQTPTPDREDIPSNLWMGPNGPMTPNVVVADDFRSDGRPITSVKWWGSYLNPEYVPPQFGGFGQPPYQIDGWLISFHRPLKLVAAIGTQAPLGLYFAPASAVQIVPTTVVPCDQHPVYEYRVRLSDCCLIQSNPDPRVPATDPNKCPAQPDSFRERRCWWYALDIQAVVGIRWVKVPGALCCDGEMTENVGLGDFWGWHATANERGKRPARRSFVTLGPPTASICPPMNLCPPDRTWRYGPWSPVPPVCTFQHRIDMAFELLTSSTVIPPPCPPLIIHHAVSLKNHTLIAPPPAGTTFGINLPLGPPPSAGVECRGDGPDRVVLTFSEDIAADDGSLDPGDEVTATGATISNLSISGSHLTVELAGVCNPCCVALTIENGEDGITTLGSDELDGDNDVHVRSLRGDVTGDAAVNIFDLISIRNDLNKPVDLSRFRKDVRTDGAINIFDLIVARNNLNHTAACP